VTRAITFDGYDGEFLACPEINVWYDYGDRAKLSPETNMPIVATVEHGSAGRLLERDGDGCLVEVETSLGTYRGWVTFWFIKELKLAWQAERLATRVD